MRVASRQATVSPPPTTPNGVGDDGEAMTRPRITDPWENFGISKRPMGPLQTIVRAFLSNAAYSRIVVVPTSTTGSEARTLSDAATRTFADAVRLVDASTSFGSTRFFRPSNFFAAGRSSSEKRDF